MRYVCLSHPLAKLIICSLQQKRGTVMTRRCCSHCLPTVVAKRLLFDYCMSTLTPKLMSLEDECIMSGSCLVLMVPYTFGIVS